MDQIAGGKGRAPKPFMLAKGTGKADAVWQSNRAEETKGRTIKPAPRAALKTGKVAKTKASNKKATTATRTAATHVAMAAPRIILRRSPAARRN